MYESLKAHSDPFHLFIFAFDDRSYALLSTLQLDYVTIISLHEFEDEELRAIKDSRSAGEYCWTCTPSTIKYCIEYYKLDSCTYLDADLYFFSNPSVLIEEMGDKSVLITEHRYTPIYDQSATSGIYCVQFMTFKNNANGMKVLNWWRNACNNWCYARFEDGKFGDQKYLDDWTTRFDGIHVLENLGGGVAPWNIQQYNLYDSNFTLIFYHFHNLKFLMNNKIELGNYRLDKHNLKFLYTPYLQELEQISLRLPDKSYDYNGIGKQNLTWKTPFQIIKRLLNSSYNIYSKPKLLGM
ncbi:MAG: hypothetical protein WCW84_00940 [Sulfurimonas sp.]|jgi:hypothetical protein